MAGGDTRKILHVDMDAFYASVEIRDDPSLAGRPVVVGGSPRSRGVVAAASYEARRFGIRSAMPCYQAWRLCPEAVFLPPDFAKYRKVSGQIHAIFRRYTDLVEPVGLDEAYLDVTVNKPGIRSATWVAREIKAAIRAETGLTASAGVATNKFLAKIASEERKPDGLFVIDPAEAPRFVAGLAVAKVPGIGRATLKVLADMGIETCGQLQQVPRAELLHRFGKRGDHFHRIARGVDDRPVNPHRLRKSVSVEDTFARDQDDPAWQRAKVGELVGGLEKRLRSAGVRGRTLTLKLRLADFSSFTRSCTLPAHTDEAAALLPHALRLLERSGFQGRSLRLLGVGLSNLDNAPPPKDQGQQLTLPGLAEG